MIYTTTYIKTISRINAQALMKVSRVNMFGDVVLSVEAISVCLLASILIFYAWKRHRTLQSLPPGPRPIPFLGNLLDLASADQLKVFQDLRKKYGDLVTLHIGSHTIVVVSGYNTLRELFVKNGHVTSDRPDLFMFTHLSKREGILSSSGTEWKIHRSFSVGTLRDLGYEKKGLEGKLMEEVEIFLQVLEQQNETMVDLSRFFQISVANIICSLVFGKRFEHGDPALLQILQLIDENLSLASSTGLLNLMPFLRFVPGDPVSSKKIIKNSDKVKEYLHDLITTNQQEYNNDDMNGFAGAYIKEIKKRADQKSTFTDSQMLHVITDLFFAGTDSITTTLRWAVLFLIRNLDVQEKCHQEIQRVVGEGRYPSLSDRENMPFMDAFITEVQRRADITPLVVPHSPSKDIVFSGYVIPKGAILIPMLSSIHSDPTLFPAPEKFDPSRFIDENGQIHDTEHVLPFFFGRRVCIGDSLAKSELFLFLTSMVQRFKFKPEDPLNVPSIKGHLGLLYQPCEFKCRVEKRS